MEKILEFMKECTTYYLATVDEQGNPQVRPFGTFTLFDGGLYIQTGNVKKVFKELQDHPRIAISATSPDGGRWIRIEADAAVDSRREARVALLEDHPSLKALYSPDDGNCEAVRLENGTATFCSFTAAPETVTF